MKDLNELVKEAVEKTLRENNLKTEPVTNKRSNEKSQMISEAYVTQSGKFDLRTELLSQKTKKAHQELLDGYVKELNDISARLDGVDKSKANLNNSQFRSLKIDETYNHNAAFLHGLYFQNISDLNSNISMDSLSYMKLSKDFGTFDAWQEDFVACCLSARNGWAMTVYNMNLKKYINTVVDLHSDSVLINCIPIVVMDCWEHSYYRDYLKDRKAYVFAMMKELNWDIIEERIQKAEKISKIL
jgi:Fe-Mn family superoxide dismutase